MVRKIALVALAVSVSGMLAQSPTPRPTFDTFEVATIKPMEPDAKSGRYITMQGNNRFVEKAYTLKLLIAAAYDLNPRTISGGPSWIESDHYDIVAKAPADTPLDEMYGPMMRALLEDRFGLKIHSEIRELPVYALTAARGGAKLTPSKPGSCVAIDVRSVLKAPPGSNYCG